MKGTRAKTKKSAEPETKHDQNSRVAFREALERHLERVSRDPKEAWTATQLSENSKKYPDFENSGISRSQAFRLLPAKEDVEKREITRPMINLIAHELAAHYEAKGDPIYSRKNVEAILYELLKAAGFSSFEWKGDQWDRIIDERDPEKRTLRVGYFVWPGFANENFTQCLSRDITEWLAHVLRIRQLVPIKLPLSALYREDLFHDIDLVAPFVDVPARRFTIACSDPIANCEVGHNALVHGDFKSKVQISSLSELRDRDCVLTYVKGGVTEFCIEVMGVHVNTRDPVESLIAAVEKVTVAPEERDGRCPVFVGDDITCQQITKESGGDVELCLRAAEIPRPLVFGLPLSRPEVLATVNDALQLLSGLKSHLQPRLKEFFQQYRKDKV